MTTILNKIKKLTASILALALMISFSMFACTSPEKAGEETEDTTEEPAATAVEEEADEHPSGEHPSDSTATDEHPSGEHPSGDDEESESN